MQARLINRAADDVLSVCRTAYPPEVARWLTPFAIHLPTCARSGSLGPADLDLRDNDGGRTAARSSQLAYAYCSR